MYRDLFYHQVIEALLWFVIALFVLLYLIDQRFLVRSKAFFSGSPLVLKGLKKSTFTSRVTEVLIDFVLLLGGSVFLLRVLVQKSTDLSQDFISFSLQVFLLYSFLILAKRYLFLFLEELLFLRKAYKPIHATFRNDLLFLSLFAVMLTTLGMYNFNSSELYWEILLYCIGVLLLISHIKTYLIFKAYWLHHWFYFLLYLCALEIIPLLLFAKLISKYLTP